MSHSLPRVSVKKTGENVKGTRMFGAEGKARQPGGNINLDETRQRKGRIKVDVIMDRLRSGAKGADRAQRRRHTEHYGRSCGSS